MGKTVCKFCVIFNLLFVFSSCCHKLEFTEDELKCFELYQKGDLVIFKSNYDNLDTMFIKEKSTYWRNNECNFIERGTTINEQRSIEAKHSLEKEYIVLDKDGDTIFRREFQFKIVNTKDTKKKEPSLIILFNLSAYEDEGYLDSAFQLTDVNIKLDTCYYFDVTNSRQRYDTKHPINYFVWSKALGLVAFEMKDGEYYEYYKLIRKKEAIKEKAWWRFW